MVCDRGRRPRMRRKAEAINSDSDELTMTSRGSPDTNLAGESNGNSMEYCHGNHQNKKKTHRESSGVINPSQYQIQKLPVQSSNGNKRNNIFPNRLKPIHVTSQHDSTRNLNTPSSQNRIGEINQVFDLSWIACMQRRYTHRSGSQRRIDADPNSGGKKVVEELWNVRQHRTAIVPKPKSQI